MTFDEARRLLASQPVFWSRLGFCYDPPRAGAFSLDRTREITGFAIAEHPGAHDDRCYDVSAAAQDCPAVAIRPDPAVKPLLTSRSGAVVLAETKRGEGVSYLCTEPMLTHDRLRALLLRADVTPTAPDGCAVYADSRFAAVCPHDDTVGRVTLPRPARELITGAAFPAGSTETPLPGRGVRFFRYADAE